MLRRPGAEQKKILFVVGVCEHHSMIKFKEWALDRLEMKKRDTYEWYEYENSQQVIANVLWHLIMYYVLPFAYIKSDEWGAALRRHSRK